MPRGNFDRDFRTGQNIGTAIGSTIGVVALLMKQRADRQRAEQTFKFASEQEKTISAKYDPQIMQLGTELTDWANDFQVNKDNAKIEEVPTGVAWTQEEVDKMTPEEKKQFAPKGATPPIPPGRGLTSPMGKGGTSGPVQWSQEDEDAMTPEERNLFIGPKAGDPKMAQHYSSNEKDIPLEVIFSSQKKLMFLGMQRDQELRDFWMNKIVENQDNKVFVNMAVGKIAAIDARFEKMMKVSSEGNGTLGNLQATREARRGAAAVETPEDKRAEFDRREDLRQKNRLEADRIKREREATAERETRKREESEGALSAPGGAIARDKESAKKWRELNMETSKARNALQVIRTLRKFKGREALPTPEKSRAKQAAATLRIAWKNMAGLGVLSASDIQMMNDVLTDDPLSAIVANSGTIDEQINGFERDLDVAEQSASDAWLSTPPSGIGVQRGGANAPAEDKLGTTKIRVSNGKETFEIDAADEAEAVQEGFKRVE